jgi:hypothetical protein
MELLMQYIQVKTNLQHAKVVRVDGREKIAFGTDEGGVNTLYLDAARAKSLAFRLLEAAKHAGKDLT